MLNIQDLHVALDAEAGLVRAIAGLDLALARGETFALVGESGCGKSMTALALMRLLPDNGRVTAGRIAVDDAGQRGADWLDLPEAAMRRVRGGRIGMIFQEPGTSLNPVMRVGEQIVEAIETHTALRGDAARAKALEWLARVGIPEPERRIDEYPFRMSGGQKQRVMIAMTLATEPEFLVADEPTTALDVTIQAQILELLKDLQRERRMGLLLITHDLAVVSGMAHRVALMYAGQIVEVAEAGEFFRAPRHPYARALLEALPGGASRGHALRAIPGTVPPLHQEFTGCRFAPRCTQATAHCAVTVPTLDSVGAGHAVRCWLFAGGGPHPSPLPQAEEGASPGAPAFHPLPLAGEGRGEGAVPTPALLDVKGLHVRYPLNRGWLGGATRWFDAVQNVSFSVSRGRTLALVGESGCGKTTTGKALVQLLRGTATIQGQALFDGEDLFQLQGDALRRARARIQIVFQDPFASLNPRMRVRDILEEGLLALRPEMDSPAREERLHTLAEQVGLRRDALLRWPHEFSGGQRQRIAIARALAVQPALIVCDEPTSALDVSVQAQILNLLAELQREHGLSFVFITHNLAVVEHLADDVVVMQRGRVVEHGSTAAVMGRPQQPYTRELLAAVPRLERTGSAD